MNILFVGNISYPKGMAGTKRIQNFIDYLSKHDVSLNILILRKQKDNKNNNTVNGNYKGVNYKAIGQNIKFCPSLIWNLPLFFIMGSLYIYKRKKKNVPNVMYCYGAPNIENMYFMLFAKLLRYKIVNDIVEDFSYFEDAKHFFTIIKWRFSVKIERFFLRYVSDGIITISDYLLKKYIDLTANKIPVILIPISAYVTPTIKKTIFNNPIKIVYSGSFAKKDDCFRLIDAFENVYKIHQNIELILTGSGEKENINGILYKIKNTSNIKYLGYMDDGIFYEFLETADILCMIRTSSKFANAGFPFKLGEYLATGNPVIASNVSDIGNYLIHKEEVFLVEPDKTNEIEKAIVYLIENPEKAIQMGLSGQKNCLRNFNPIINGKKLSYFLMGL